jgi:hypothetical protein
MTGPRRVIDGAEAVRGAARHFRAHPERALRALLRPAAG